MYRFTTPIHAFKFPDSVNLNDLSEILITYSQSGRIKFEKKKSDLLFTDNNVAYFRITQEESSLFNPDLKAKLQVRIVYSTGETYASEIKDVLIKQVLHEGILEVE